MDKATRIHLQAEKERLIKSIEPIQVKIEAINALLNLYPDEDVRDITESHRATKSPKRKGKVKLGYGGINDKIISIITKEGKFIKALKLTKLIYGAFPDKDNKNAVSGALAYLKRNNRVNRYKIDGSNNLTFWGLWDWFDANENPKEEYKA